jgi:hypothetical protein
MKSILVLFSCFLLIGCFSKGEDNMFFGNKVKKIEKIIENN